MWVWDDAIHAPNTDGGAALQGDSYADVAGTRRVSAAPYTGRGTILASLVPAKDAFPKLKERWAVTVRSRTVHFY